MQSPHLNLTGQLRCQTRYLELGDMVFPPQSDWPAETSDPIPLSWVTWCPHLSLTGQLRCQPNTIELGDMVSPSQSDWPVEAVDLELNETVSTLV